MAIPLITNLPPAPSRLETEETFVPKADALLSQLPTFVEETNTSIGGINSTANQVTADKATTGQYLLEAETARDAAIASAVYKGTWEGKTSAGVIGESYSYQGSYIYRLNVGLDNLSESVPSPTNTDWQLINVVPFEAPCKATLDLDFANQDFTIYDKLGGFVKRPLSDIVTQSRSTAGNSVDAIGGITEFAAGENRFTFDGETGQALGYLSEESRTNLLTYSEDFTNAVWVKSSLTVNSSLEIAPDVTSTAYKLIPSNSVASHFLARTFTGLTVGNKYTFSIFLKKSEYKTAAIAVSGGADANTVVIDLDNGIITAGQASITDVWGEYYRVSIVYTAISTTLILNAPYAINGDSFDSRTVAGDGLSGIYAWGAQLEVGSFPTSYIRTLGAPVTRGSDSMTRTLGQEWNPNEGTFVIEFELPTDHTTIPANCTVFSVGSDSQSVSSESLNVFASGSIAGRYVLRFGGVDNLFTNMAGQRGVLSLSFSKDSASMSVSGSSTISIGSSTDPSLFTKILSDAGYVSGSNKIRTIKRLQYYPRAFDALTLQRLSRIQ